MICRRTPESYSRRTGGAAAGGSVRRSPRRGAATITDMSQPSPAGVPGAVVPPPPQRSRLLPATALVIALAALALSGWAVWRTFAQTATEPEYTQAQRDQAKQSVCAAAELVRKGVALNTSEPSPAASGDVIGSLAVAANARLSLFEGGQYLRARLGPAVPTALSDAVGELADGLMDIGAAATAGAVNTDSDQAARLRDAEAADGRVRELCA
jgi:hypothetical protein